MIFLRKNSVSAAAQAAITDSSSGDVTAVSLAANTATAPAAVTSTAPSVGYVQAEAAAVQADVVALRATVAALVTDNTAHRNHISRVAKLANALRSALVSLGFIVGS